MPKITHLSNKITLLEAECSGLDITNDGFEPEFWQQQNKIIGSSFGRNTTYFFQQDEGKYVLRHYYRGGLIQKIRKDKYLFFGIKKTRVYQEFELLELMRNEGLAVPNAIAARIIKSGLSYTADLIMELISDAEDVFHLLGKKSLKGSDWQNIGTTLASFHNKGFYHADLNIHNIMLDKSGKVWLIDFDRGQQLKPQKQWQQSNIQRLLRSFEKEKSKNNNLYFEQNQLDLMLQSYQASLLRS